ncbi:MAG: PQQ-dependent sugar dehydrogenase [Candidatus Acidiferrum sp.]
MNAFRSLRSRVLSLAGLIGILLVPQVLSATSYKQPGFSETAAFSGLVNPTTVRFLPDGTILVAEKSGLIKQFDSLTDPTPTVVADLRIKVHNFWDRGLLGLAIDPNFLINHYVYVVYSHDAPIGGIAPKWGPGDDTSDPCPTPPGATTDGCVVSSHLSRLVAVGSDWTASEQVLIEDWCQQFPSHSAGALGFGADGMLYVSHGEGASFYNLDWGQFGGTLGVPPPTPKNPCGDPPVPVGGDQTKPTAEGGSLRSQSPRRTAGEPRVLNGSVLRVDPATGAGVPGNPLFGSSDTDERRIIGYGFRNPFRMIVKPGTNDVWVADVGASTNEEINRVPDLTSARNFGWPCFEGPLVFFTGLNICPTQAETTPPFYTYTHDESVVAGDGCSTGSSSIAGMAFYQGASNYPAPYNGALFFSDYSRKCMWVMFPGGNGDPDPATRAAFAATDFGPVDLQIGPDGNLYYVNFDGGKIMKVKYGLSAVAVATSPTSGSAPLTVSFDGTGSVPAQVGDTLTFAWDLDGDGVYDDSSSTTPSYTYSIDGIYEVRLKVTDQRGGSDISAPITITVGNTPPTATVLTPPSSLMWKVGDVVSFSGEAADTEDGTLSASALSWSIIIHHCPSDCHTHVYQTFSGVASGSFPAPDHEYPSYLEIQLTATDSGGLTGTASVLINPQTVDLTLQSVPSGLLLTAGTTTATTPFARTVIVNSQAGLDAPSPQGLWVFVSWSDGGAQSHTVIATSSPATYTATFCSAPAAPQVTAPLWAAVGATGLTASVPFHAGSTYSWTLTGGTITGGQGSSQITFDAGPPGTTMVLQVIESSAGCTSPAATAAIQVDFLDVPPENLFHDFVDTIARNSITAGCGDGTLYCPDDPNTRAQMAVFLLKSELGASYTPPPAVGVFADVPADDPFAPWIEDLYNRQITGGCNPNPPPLQYCPDRAISRAEMAVLLLKTLLGVGYTPPPAVGIFADVAKDDPFAPWIEDLYNRQVTGGCFTDPLWYCPERSVTRAEMAVFLTKTFGLT